LKTGGDKRMLWGKPVRISEKTHRLAEKLAEKNGEPKASIVTKAVENYCSSRVEEG